MLPLHVYRHIPEKKRNGFPRIDTRISQPGEFLSSSTSFLTHFHATGPLPGSLAVPGDGVHVVEERTAMSFVPPRF